MNFDYEKQIVLPSLKEREVNHRYSRNFYLGATAMGASLAGYTHDIIGGITFGAAAILTSTLALRSMFKQKLEAKRIEAIENRMFSETLQTLEQSEQIV